MTSAPFHRPVPAGSPGKPEPFTFRGQHPTRFENRSLAPVFGIGAAVPKTLLREAVPPVIEPEAGQSQSGKAPAVPVPSPALFASKPKPVESTEPAAGFDERGAEVFFTGKARQAVHRLGLSFQAAAALVRDPDIVAPDDQQTPGREVHYSGDYGFICAIDGGTEPGVYVLGAFERSHGGGQAPESLREVKRPQPRYSGAGKATGTMPTSFEEVVERARATEGWSVEPGRGKYPWVIVSADGKHRHPVAAGAHDFRAVRNFVAQLRASGLDVRRPAGGAKH